MKKVLKMVAAILIITILNVAILLNVVNAVEGGKINIYTKGNFKRVIKYDGILVKTAYAVYEKDGYEYPVYCLNKDLHGVGDNISTYDVSNQGKITDIGLWRVIINGYPYKSIEQLGLADEGEAYTATKQAIYCYIYNRGTEKYEGIGDEGNRVINAINTILENAKKSTESFEEQSIKIASTEEWTTDNEQKCIVKQYEIDSKINISKFKVNLENQPSGTKITNLENQEKNEFNPDEQFKIFIPIKSLEKDGEFKIKIQTEMETKPIFIGKAPSDELQDYALTAYSYENIDKELIEKYEKNETKIIIEKQDRETGEVLNGAKFEILNENMKVITVVETNEQGQIMLNQIIPGIYYIREVTAPEGYEKEEQLQKVEIKLNKIQMLKIKNNKIIIENPVEDKVIETYESKLPITGM